MEGQNFLAVVQKKIAQRYEKIQNHQQQTIGVLPSKELNQVAASGTPPHQQEMTRRRRRKSQF